MGLREEIEPYRQFHGLVTPTTYEGTGNGILYASIYFILLKRLGIDTPEDFIEFEQVMRACQTKVLGLYNRTPGDYTLQEAADDLIWLCYAAKLYKSTIALEVLSYLRAHNWNYNNFNPDVVTGESYLGRMFQVRAHLYYCVGIEPPWWAVGWHKMALLSSISTLKEDQTALLAYAYYSASPHRDITERVWADFFDRAWPNGFSGVLASHLGANHPLARYWR